MNLKPILILLLVSIITDNADAQSIGIDRTEKSIFTYYSVPDDRFTASADGSVSYSMLLKKPKEIKFVVPNSGRITAKKLRATNLDIEVSTDQDLFSSEDLTKLRPGASFKLGRQTTIDQFQSLEASLPTSKKSLKTYGINGIFGFSNIKYYDSAAKNTSKKYPLDYGAEAYINFIFKNSNPATKARMILALTSSLTWTWNDDDLLSYQKVSNSIITSSVVALEEFEGRFGVLKTNLMNFRASASLPMYFGHFNPIPYLAVKFREESTPSYYFGLFVNILGDKDLFEAQLFKIPTTLGFGIDWRYQASDLSMPAFFIKGEIGFGK